jgi:putative ABC transport system substrate-binding protein
LPAATHAPGGNATGINLFSVEVVAKRLGLLHELVPKAVRVAALVNSGQWEHQALLAGVAGSCSCHGHAIPDTQRSTIGEIEAAFATLARESPDALFVATDSFLFSRHVQVTTLAARERIAAVCPSRDWVARRADELWNR